ncbi:hypothetical protein SCUP515_10865 [Seiridium cupressi]
MLGFQSIRRRLRGLRSRNSDKESTEQVRSNSMDQCWQEFAENQEALMALAQSINSVPNETSDPDVVDGRRLTQLEKLPQELQLQIMKDLDSFSLYQLTRAYEIFHRLAFDNEFENDSDWRTARHVLDTYGTGSASRVLSHTVEQEEEDESRWCRKQ